MVCCLAANNVTTGLYVSSKKRFLPSAPNADSADLAAEVSGQRSTCKITSPAAAALRVSSDSVNCVDGTNTRKTVSRRRVRDAARQQQACWNPVEYRSATSRSTVSAGPRETATTSITPAVIASRQQPRRPSSCDPTSSFQASTAASRSRSDHQAADYSRRQTLQDLSGLHSGTTRNGAVAATRQSSTGSLVAQSSSKKIVRSRSVTASLSTTSSDQLSRIRTQEVDRRMTVQEDESNVRDMSRFVSSSLSVMTSMKDGVTSSSNINRVKTVSAHFSFWLVCFLTSSAETNYAPTQQTNT